MTDRTADWQSILRAKRPQGDNRPVSNVFRSSVRKVQGGGPAAMSRMIMAGIDKTAKMLKSNECAYTSVHGGLSDPERDELDSTTGKFISDCGQRIDEVNSLIMSGKHSSNELAHLKGAVLILMECLEAVSSHFQKFKIFRYQHADSLRRGLGMTSAAVPRTTGTVVDQPELDAEEAALLQEENAVLLGELDSKLEQLRHAERELALVSSMCQLTSQKILEQAEAIEDILSNVITSVDNIDQGNVQLQKAAEAMASSRVLILTFLFVASLVLLFLHWFMD